MKPTQVMDEILDMLARQHEELDGFVAGLDEAGWALPSGCPDWSISDVLLHLAQTDEMATASAERRFAEAAAAFAGRAAGSEGATIDDLAGLAVAAERGRPGKEVYDRWRTASEAQAKALARRQPGDRVPWVAGDLSALTLATTRLSESWIHTGDVAAALGHQMIPDERLRPIARLAWRTLPYAFARSGARTLSGAVAIHLTAPDGSAWEFTPDEPAATTIIGPALDFCLVAARRADPADTALTASGPDADAVLELVRTFA